MISDKQNMFEQKAFAKINLILKVLNKRPDNYHNIFTLMHKISLYDTITVLPYSENISVECDVNLGISQEENIVYKAAKALLEYTNTDKTAQIKIQKKIPIGAGLGGGSSNAATTLKLLNQYWKLNLSMSSLHKIAITLGSDVPFFLEDYPKWVYGKGEFCEILDLIRKVNGRLEYYYSSRKIIIVYPKIHINTGLAYQKLNRDIEDTAINYDTHTEKIMKYENMFEYKSNNISSMFFKKKMINDFEEIIFDEYPEIAEIYKDLKKASRGKTRLTGSGSSVFGLFGNIKKAKNIQIQLKQKYKEENKDYKVYLGKLIP